MTCRGTASAACCDDTSPHPGLVKQLRSQHPLKEIINSGGPLLSNVAAKKHKHSMNHR